MKDFTLQTQLASDFPEDTRQLLAGIVNARFAYVEENARARAGKLNNFGKQTARDDTDEWLSERMEQCGLTRVERSIGSHQYYEFQTEHFRFMQKQWNKRFRLKNGPLMRRYAVEMQAPMLPLFQSEVDGKFPLILLSVVDLAKRTYYCRLVARDISGDWIPDVCVEISRGMIDIEMNELRQPVIPTVTHEPARPRIKADAMTKGTEQKGA